MFDVNAPVSAAYDLVSTLTSAITPVFGSGAAVAAIVLFTLAVRLLLLPLAVRQAGGEKARARIMPELQKLQQRHAGNPERLRRELAELQAREGAGPLTGCLPALAQWPFFMVMYRLFVSTTIAGQANVLLAHSLLGASLGQTWIGVLTISGLVSAPSAVFVGLLVLLSAVAWWSSRRGTTTLLKILPFGTVVFAAFTPLAAGIYLLVSGTWTAAERSVLHRAWSS
jgi:YidC/Oxa1 family membrane protein insertase